MQEKPVEEEKETTLGVFNDARKFASKTAHAVEDEAKKVISSPITKDMAIGGAMGAGVGARMALARGIQETK